MRKAYILSFLLLITVYILLIFTIPTDPAVLKRLELTQGEARLLNVGVVLPLVAIFLAALYGAVRIKNYASHIAKTTEGPAFQYIANGLMVLSIGLPLNSVAGSLVSYVRHVNPDLLSEVTIFRNYLALAVTLWAFYLIAKGARGLVQTVKKGILSESSFLDFFGPIFLAAIYSWLITAKQDGVAATDVNYLPDWALVLTIVIPYTFIWCIGIQASVRLYRYRLLVKGTIYRRAILYISQGVGVIIVTSILIRFLMTLSGQLNQLDLTPLLTVVYLLVLLYAIGYGLIARGAKKLKLIEEA